MNYCQKCLQFYVFGVLLLSGNLWAQFKDDGSRIYPIDPSTYVGPRSAGRAGATVASVGTLHDAVFQNPASAAFSEKYAVTLGMHGTGSALAASIVDTKTGPIGGALYYLSRHLSGATRYAPSNVALNDTVMGASFMGRLAPSFGAGVNVKQTGKTLNGDVGLRMKPADMVAIGVLAQNVLDNHKVGLGKMGSAAIEFNYGTELLASFQAAALLAPAQTTTYSIPEGDAKKINLGGSLEYNTSGGINLALGYSTNQIWREDMATGGVGYESTNFGFQYGLQYGTTKKFLLHSITAAGYF